MTKSRGHFSIAFVLVWLLAASLACMEQAPEHLNEGRGTRDDPVPARVYAKTTNYEVRAQNAVRPMAGATPTQDEEFPTEYLKVQFEIKCIRGTDEICDLNEIGPNLTVISDDGVIYEADMTATLPAGDSPLDGEILGGAEQAGWLVYQVPTGIPVTLALAKYGQDQRIFFKLP
jgi:hypothetical protein